MNLNPKLKPRQIQTISVKSDVLMEAKQRCFDENITLSGLIEQKLSEWITQKKEANVSYEKKR